MTSAHVLEQAVPRVPACSAAELDERYIATSTPVVFTGAVQDWPGHQSWSPDSLAERFADRMVVASRTRGGKLVVSDDGGIPQLEMKFSHYLEQLRSGVDDLYLVSPIEERFPELLDELVLPDSVREASWHSARLWLGAPNATVPLHRDFPENLYAQLFGRKRITLIAPRYRRRLYSRSMFSAAPNFSRVDLESPDYERFPQLRGVPRLVCDVEPGELLYIPRLWWHHVVSLETSVSINFWFANGTLAVIARLLQSYARLRGLRK